MKNPVFSFVSLKCVSDVVRLLRRLKGALVTSGFEFSSVSLWLHAIENLGGENFKLDDLENFFRQRYPAIEVVDHVDKNNNIGCYKKKDIMDGLQGVAYIIANGGDGVKLFEKFFNEGYRTTQC
ncbi:hypothetical protein Tco_1076423 [Tanacetum coccineum]